MGLMHKVEGLFEKNIEGFFNRKLHGELQPVEIAKKIVRKMEDARSVGISKVYVPNRYLVFVHEADFANLAPYWEKIREDLADYLLRQINDKGYVIVGHPIIDLFFLKEDETDWLRVTSEFTEPIEEEEESPVPENTGDLIVPKVEHTQVFARSTIPPMQSSQSAASLQAVLTVTEGTDKGVKTNLFAGRTNIGRRAGNELVLSDLNVSRLHSFITLENGHHVLYDAKSLNGTYLNEERVNRKELKSGDTIRLGNTVLLYEVT